MSAAAGSGEPDTTLDGVDGAGERLKLKKFLLRYYPPGAERSRLRPAASLARRPPADGAAADSQGREGGRRLLPPAGGRRLLCADVPTTERSVARSGGSAGGTARAGA